MKHRCPFCGAALLVGRQDDRGIVRLSARCTGCRERIDAAGIGAERAEADLADKCERRQGTTPAEWRIGAPTRRRGPRTRG